MEVGEHDSICLKIEGNNENPVSIVRYQDLVECLLTSSQQSGKQIT
jgi:hypothetical protein